VHVPTEKRKITIIIIIIITIWNLESGQRGGGRGAEGERVTERGEREGGGQSVCHGMWGLRA